MRRMRGLGQEAGQTAAEFLGVLALIALVVALLAASSIAPVFRAANHDTTCAILNDPTCAPPGALPAGLREEPAQPSLVQGVPAGAAESSYPGNQKTAERNLLDNVAGFFRGAASQVGEMVTGVVDLAGWGWRSLTSHDQRVENGLLWRQLRDHPGESLRAILAGVVEPILAEWRAGRPGAAVGRGGVEIASVFFGTHGLDKLRALALANHLDTAADSTGVLARLRAVDWSDETGAISFGGRLPSRTELARRLQTAERAGSGLKSDPYHRAASFALDDLAERGEIFLIRNQDGRNLVLGQVEGAVNGKPGVFEWLVDDGVVVHQLFKADAVVDGMPNRPPRAAP